MKLNQLICKLQQLETDGLGNCDVFINDDDYDTRQLLCSSDIDVCERPNLLIDDDYIELLNKHISDINLDSPCVYIG